jgi:transposase InsO family protein
MGQILHKRATTTHAIRAAIQQSQESIRTLAERYHVNPKTILKWKKRDTVQDAKMGKKLICSTVLTSIEEEMIVRIRVLTQLSLDDLFVVLLDTIPHLKRTTLYNCLRRHGVHTLPKEEKTRKKQEFKEYKIGYFHVDTAEVKTAEGKAYLFVAIDRTSKFTVARLYPHKTVQSASDFLNYIIQMVPYVIEKILTDNGMEYTDMITHKGTPSGAHAFDQICTTHFIEHRLTQVKHPWTNGQVERMNRTLKENTVKKYHYGDAEQLNRHIQDFLRAYNCAKKLKALAYKTPLEYLMQIFLNKPILFKKNPFLYYSEPYS